MAPSVRRWLALAFVAVSAAIAVLAPTPDAHLRSALRLHDFLHVPGFGFVLAVLWFGFPAPEGAPRGHLALRLLGMFAAAVALGVVVEIAQGALRGFADPWDAGRNAVGAGAAALAIASLHRDTTAPARWGLRAAAAAGVLAALIPYGLTIAQEVRAARRFPVLVDFGSPSDLERFDWSPWSSGAIESPGDGGARGTLRVQLHPGAFPGLWLEYFPRDWRGWKDLVLDCTNPETAPLPVTVWIDDLRHDPDYQESFHRDVVLAPGRNEIRIPLADVESALRGREPGLSGIRYVGVFSARLEERRTLLFHEFRLDP